LIYKGILVNFSGRSDLVYGLDPRRDKQSALSVGVTAEEVIDVLDEAEGRVMKMFFVNLSHI
jgi:hypothetical protein